MRLTVSYASVVAADGAHLLAADAWLGGLVPLAFLLALASGSAADPKIDIAHILTRFSGMGYVAVAMLTGTREQMDTLHRRFRSLLEGTKELQLNSDRGRYFVEDVLASAARRVRHMFIRALVAYLGITSVRSAARLASLQA